MAKLMFEVDVGRRATLFAKLMEQAPLRAMHGELAFNVQVNDNARRICYIFLEWKSLASAQDFLDSPTYHDVVAEWPVNKILRAIPLKDLGEQIRRVEEKGHDV